MYGLVSSFYKNNRQGSVVSDLLARGDPINSCQKKWKRRKMLVFQSCPTLCYSLNCSPPGSSFPGILQARMLECIAIPSSRESSWTRDRTWVSCNKCQSWVSNSNSLALELELLTWHCRAPPVSLLGHLGVTGARASIRPCGEGARWVPLVFSCSDQIQESLWRMLWVLIWGYKYL